MSAPFAADDPVEPYGQVPPPGHAGVVARLRAELADARRRLQEAERLADRDPLAPVLNRRAFLRELNRTVAYCQRYGAEASLVYFDLDGFKAVNDTYGHAAGDQALRAAAAALSAHVRESDVVGRLGGDEFGVILAQADKAAAELKAASLVAEIEKSVILAQGSVVRVAASFGVRAFEAGLDAAQMLAEADAAMFLHKGRAGRSVARR